ncbi:MAG: hypothetical protein Q8S27_23955, partial [Hoeflea sp.]|nr:hypothetical protein [Hoeflea sp.]
KLHHALGHDPDGERLACFSEKVGQRDFTALVGCLGGGKPSADKVASCVTDPNLFDRVDGIRSCVAESGSAAGSKRCLLATIPPKDQALMECLVSSKPTSECLEIVSPEIRKYRHIQECVTRNTTNTSRVSCISHHSNADAARVAGCLAQRESLEVAICALGDDKNTKILRRIAQCTQAGKGKSSILANCTEGIIDDKTRQVAGCVVDAGSDKRKLAACAAGVALPPEAARLVGCATDSQGPTSFALCAAGPQINEEWRIAAECAVQSGGEPTSFVTCTAGRLTVRELTKCFTGEIGKDCFGPNNTIVATLRNYYSDLLNGPGENNDIVNAFQEVGKLAGGPNSVIINPQQIWGGKNSVFNRPEQILGGNKSVFNNPEQVLDPRKWRF